MTEQEQTQNSGSKKWVFGIIGFLLGGPISYLFQSSLIREKISFGEYAIKSHMVMLDSQSWGNNPIVGNVGLTILVTCVICALVLFFVGSQIDKNK